MKKVFFLSFLLLSISLLVAQEVSPSLNDLSDTTAIKKQVDRFSRINHSIPEEDSLLGRIIRASKGLDVPSWEVRFLNCWSQQKVSQAIYPAANSLISEALNIAEQSPELRNSVDYRDALVQKTLVLFYQSKWDSCLYYAGKGVRLSHDNGDSFNESICLTQTANVYGITQKHSEQIEPLYLRAKALAQKTATLHDDVMMLHNYSYFLKTAPRYDLKKSMEILISMQPFSREKELITNETLPYRRAAFFYRGAYLQLLQQLSEDYYYLGDFDQAIAYANAFTQQKQSEGGYIYMPYLLIQRVFLQTCLGNVHAVQQGLDSALQLYRQNFHREEMPLPAYNYVKGWLAEQENHLSQAFTFYRKAAEQDKWIAVNENHIGLFRTAVKMRDIPLADSLFRVYTKGLNANIVSYYKIFFYKELPAYYRLKKKDIAALQASLRYYELKDSMTGISSYLIASSLEKKFQLREKDRLLTIAEKEQEWQQKKSLALITGIFFLLLLLLLLYLNYRLKKKQALALQSKNKEIETLIRELHHRVKNNLQTVSGLLSLQRNRIQDDGIRQMMEEGKNRVEAMALIHQKLYMNNELASVNIKDYLEELGGHLAESFGYKRNTVKTEVRLADGLMDIDRAIPIGLIVNELITNAFKYAFAGVSAPEILLSLIENSGKVELQVADNGSGLDPEKTGRESFGLKLVNMLVSQLDGELTTRSGNGTTYHISIQV